MKRWLAIIIVTTILLSATACHKEILPSPQGTTVATDTTIATTSKVLDTKFVLGNLQFPLGLDLDAEKVNDNQYTLIIKPGKAYVMMYAKDVSNLDVAKIGAFLQSQTETLAEDCDTVYGVTEASIDIAGFNADIVGYGTIVDGEVISRLDISFTDTWYAYTFYLYCHEDNEDSYKHSKRLGSMLSHAKYIGNPPREDYPVDQEETTPACLAATDPPIAEPQITNPPVTEPPAVNPTATNPPATEPPATNPPATEPPATQTSATTGEKNALSKAKSYLSIMAFSYSGLIDQLEFEGFTTAEATYAADNCGANWNEQALKKAKNYLDIMAFSYSGLVGQLEFEGFTSAEASYGADNCGADWFEQAAKKAKSYLDTMTFSREGLISQLEYEGFTHEQAVHGVEANGL